MIPTDRGKSAWWLILEFSFNLVIEKLLIPTTGGTANSLSASGFQSRNRETFDSNSATSPPTICEAYSFQSRNRETFDSNVDTANLIICIRTRFNLVIEKLLIPTKGNGFALNMDMDRCFNLVIEKLLIPTKMSPEAIKKRIQELFQSRNRETFDSNVIPNVVISIVTPFQSRNRETFDSNEQNNDRT